VPPPNNNVAAVVVNAKQALPDDLVKSKRVLPVNAIILAHFNEKIEFTLSHYTEGACLPGCPCIIETNWLLDAKGMYLSLCLSVLVFIVFDSFLYQLHYLCIFILFIYFFS
jgi:hypothetical protein